jgi:hypothetical protein
MCLLFRRVEGLKESSRRALVTHSGVPEGEASSDLRFGSVVMRQQKPEERRPKANSYSQAKLAEPHFIISQISSRIRLRRRIGG